MTNRIWMNKIVFADYLKGRITNQGQHHHQYHQFVIPDSFVDYNHEERCKDDAENEPEDEEGNRCVANGVAYEACGQS